MRKTLADIMSASREADCPIVHIGRLAGEGPFSAGSPCLGNAPVPLLEITPDDYLAIMAEIRHVLTIEHDESLAFLVFTGGARDPQAAHERHTTKPRTIAGSITVAATTAALYYLMDSAGQETTIIYNGLRSFDDIQAYWRRRGELVRAFAEVYTPIEADVADLCYHLDRTTQLATFDLDAFARGRGLTANLQYYAAG
jgi:hypothetical protein